MIVSFLGGLIAALTLFSDDCNYYVVAGGIVIMILGILSSDMIFEERKARGNRRRYWAYGEPPDWVRKDKKGDD